MAIARWNEIHKTWWKIGELVQIHAFFGRMSMQVSMKYVWFFFIKFEINYVDSELAGKKFTSTGAWGCC